MGFYPRVTDALKRAYPPGLTAARRARGRRRDQPSYPGTERSLERKVMNGPVPYGQPLGQNAPRRRRGPRWMIVGIAVVFIAIATLLLVILLYPSAFGLSQSSNPYSFGPFGGFFLVFFILIVAFFIVRVLFWSMRARRYGAGGGAGYGGRYGPNRPAMIARMRYARGEITREQYDQIMQDLGRRPGPP